MVTPPDRRAPARPPLPGPFRQQRPPASPVLQQRSFAALMLALISLFGMIVLHGNLHRAVVVLAVTLVIGATGLYLAITSMSRSRREGTSRPRMVILATVLAVGGTGLSALALAGFALFWTPINQYADCRTAANTVSAQNACQQQLNNSLQSSLGVGTK
jgi:hypothetical protein